MSVLIQKNEELKDFCRKLKGHPFITVDTEFIREKTYWPRLCLIQLASTEDAACVDPLAEGIDLSPVFEIMRDETIVKVFHAARQDVEIFYHLTGKVPSPIFDTQVAAMVCGFGESVSYQTLVSKLAHTEIDKTMRFTDWSRRPLTEKQVKYALHDVTYLRDVYARLTEILAQTGRESWVAEEIAFLSDPATYENDPQKSWLRIKQNSNNPEFLAILQALAAWREEEAQKHDRPRKHIMRDELLLEIAASAPKTLEEMKGMRSLPQGFAEGRLGTAARNVIAEVISRDPSTYPAYSARRDLPKGTRSLAKLLKLLLTVKAEQHDVAEKLLASSDDVDLLASEESPDIPALKGWRFDVFGKDALALKNGKLALCYNPKKHRMEFRPL